MFPPDANSRGLSTTCVTLPSFPITAWYSAAISRDGSRVAFSCEHKGTWQVHILNLHTGEDVQLTHADCNSITPVWSRDGKDLIYATDCGRGLGLTALARLRVP